MGRRYIKSILFAVAALALAATASAQDSPATSGSADTVTQDLREQEALLLAPPRQPINREQEAGRDEAARRLVSRGSAEARQIIKRVIENPVAPWAQAAAARALAGDPSPDPALVDPLAGLMGADPDLTDAAAQALAQEVYSGVDAAWPRLRDRALVQNQPWAARRGIVRAMGKLVSKQVAATLMGLMNDDTVDSRVRDAAADAIVEISGEPNMQRDTNLIRKWWRENANRPDRDWQQSITEQRARRVFALKAEMAEFYAKVLAFTREQYRAAAANKKDAMLLGFLTDGKSPQMRRIGVELVKNDFGDNGKRPSPEVAAQLYRLVGDSATEVRQEVALTLKTLNDENAIKWLIAQLGQERDVEVRFAIAGALGPMSVGSQNLTVVDPLTAALVDESSRVSEAAARSLKEVAPIALRQDPPLAKRLGGVMEKRLATAERGSALRDVIVETMATLHDPAMLNEFYQLLDKQESTQVRRAALMGLAGINNPDAGNEVARLLDDGDRGVRLEAAITLGKIGSYPHVDALLRRLSDRIEADATVSQAAWQSITSLAPKGSAKDLDNLADQLNKGEVRNPARRLAVLEVEAKKLEAAGSRDELAAVQQNIGDACAELPQPDWQKAQAAYEQAFDYWVSTKAKSLYDPLVGKRLECLLRAGDYPGAMQLATKVVAMGKEYTQTAGNAMQLEVQRLRAQKEYTQALALIAEVEKIASVLGPLYTNNFKDLREQTLRDANKGGLHWWQDHHGLYAWRTPSVAGSPLSLAPL